MESIGTALEAIAETMTTNSPSDENGYTCEHCGKFIEKIQVEMLGHKKLVQPRCECDWKEQKAFLDEAAERKHKREIEKLFSISNLGQRFEDSGFESFTNRTGTEKAFQIAQKYVDEFEEWGSDSLLIWGVPGNGKSHLASAIANELKAKGKIVVFQSVPELLERIRSTFNRDSKESESQIMKALLTCDLLIMDDIGAEKLTDWVQDVVFRIIDGRYRKQKPILYTSNLHPERLETQLSERTYDRITETSLIIRNKATSYRKEIAKERIRRNA